MTEPKRIGRFLFADKAGFLQADVSKENISSEWMPALDFIVESLRRAESVQSIYIRGSIPRGLAIAGTSDADFIYISEFENESLEKEIAKTVAINFPIVTKVELARIDQAKLSRIGKGSRRRPYYHMLLKTQSLCLAGNDINREILPFKIGSDLASHIFSLKEEFVALPAMIAEDIRLGESPRRAIQWFSRRLVRSGLEVTLNRADRFTRDLYLCYEQFSDFYPRYSGSMYQVLNLPRFGGHVFQ